MKLKKHKQYINEWKSVNDDVKKLSENIAKIMWRKSENDKPMLDNVINIPFIGGEFYLPMNDVFKDNEEHFGVDGMNVWYKIYFVDSEEEYSRLYMNFGNSEYNKEENRIYIRGGLIRGQYNRTIVDDIYHELTHAFEYSMGMEKRVDLYDAVASKLTDSNSLPVEITMCKIIYYTFPHEQDAFAHQFYGYLNVNNIYDSFDNLLYGFQNFFDFVRSIIEYGKYAKVDSENVKKTLEYLGMTKEQFNKRLDFGKKRFVNKLRRVYQRHMYEMSRKKLNVEGVLKEQFLKENILKKYKNRYNDIKFENEKDFLW